MIDKAVVERVVVDLVDHFSELDDADDPLFGEYAIVIWDRKAGLLTVTHQTKPWWGVEITIKAIGERQP